MSNQQKAGKYRVIFRFLKGSIYLFVFTLIFSMLCTVSNALTPQIIRYTVDHILTGTGDASGKRALLLAAAAIVGAAVLSGIFTYLSKMSLAKGSENFMKNIRDTLFSHIEKLPFAWHVRHQTGEIIQRCTSDVDVIRNFVCNQFPEVFRIIFLLVFYLAIMFSMNVKLSVVAVVFLPVIMGYSGFFYSKIGNRFLKADQAEGELSSTVQENLTGVRVVRAFGREKFEIDRFDDKNDAFANLWIRLGKIMSAYWATGDFISNLQILSVLVLGTVFTVHNELSLGEFLAFISYNSSLTWPIRSLGRILSDMSKANVSMERVVYILDAEEEKEEGKALKAPLNGDIVFDHVTFSYEEGHPILDDMTFTIKAGSTFGILGSTGSGKSTLMHLLNRLYDLPPECGRITIGGVDIRDIKREYLREGIGMVLQEPFLFSRSIGENIGITKEASSEKQIRHAARIACVDEAIDHFADGYETIVGERGVTLSGGQKQRVAIARMLMRNAPILVFDDSLSAVDAETDAKIRHELKEEMNKATVILISHRITSLKQADCILVMDKGKVSQIGTHEKLIQRKGTYKDIFEIQMNSDIRIMEGGGLCE